MKEQGLFACMQSHKCIYVYMQITGPNFFPTAYFMCYAIDCSICHMDRDVLAAFQSGPDIPCT